MAKAWQPKDTTEKDGEQGTNYDHFTGEVRVIPLDGIPSDVEALVVKAKMLGLDLEWKDKGPIAVVSIALDEPSPTVLLLRVHGEEGSKKLPGFLEAVLTSNEVKKVIGGYWYPKRNDPRKLEETFDIKFDALQGFVGLANFAENKGLKERERRLEDIAAVFGWTIKKDKSITTSDWEADELSQDQKQSAADDVWFTLQCFRKLEEYEAPKVKPTFVKVKDVTPDGKGVNLMLKCVRGAVAVEGRDDLQEAVYGDDTGIVTVSLRAETDAALRSTGASVRLQNAHVRMIKGHIRLLVDKWAALKVTDEPHNFELKETNDISATEYELVGQ